MKIEIESTQDLTLEQKIQMHEAREAIIERLARDLPKNIDLERFLNVVVSEIGKMFNADRCNLIEVSKSGKLKISHEWQKNNLITSARGLEVEIRNSLELLQLTKPIRINDTASVKDPLVNFFAKKLGTKSFLIVPIFSSKEGFGFLCIHTKEKREWLDEEVTFLESIARHLAIGYEYTRLYVAQQLETKRTNTLLEIANIINSHLDFTEVSSKVLERALEILGANYGALGVLDKSAKKISLACFKSSPNNKPNSVLQMIQKYGGSLDVESFSALSDLIRKGETLVLFDKNLPASLRIIFNSKLAGKAAVVAPVRVGGQTFGLLGFVWGEKDENGFERHEIALVEAIADQIGTALERDRLTAEVMRLKSELHEKHLSQIIGRSPAIRNAIELALSVATTKTTVLIQGESGTGKELLADLIHYNSGREDKPYIKINCGAIPETLIESELFGHEKGAFTDAKLRRKGKFEEANGGTLFLDEIAELPLSSQVKLLRVLQDGEFTRIGGNEVIKTDVRVIAATNVELEKAVEEGRFRRDLFYRLSVFPIKLPPLRERREDIHLLVLHFLDKYKQKTGRFVAGISKEALQALTNYDWPGNVRELENAIERAVIIASGREIKLQDLPESIKQKAPQIQVFDYEKDLTSLKIHFPSPLAEIEKIAIEKALEYTGGDKSRASKLLKIGRKTLYRKLKQYRNGS
ncbi:MAG: sigma 54-interacting transcriptional regulator [Pyrinomonadaceae bacterium]|nr:sigma 54-interacting transcriptional regulator [Pyrinomonadaceae bacterium]MCX7639888.1 sigma 54-interacting transcriptional regulator [Pyrinomonadaceae bacterium]MDW8304060.1 sigma 54-interacting transcriptional regulator [Acidobacteriota bacterium]